MSALDLHALAALPGAGRAAEALRKAGFWDEAASPGRKRFEVTLTGASEAALRAVVVVEADDAEEAERKASNLDPRSIDWELDDEGDVEITDAEATCLGPADPDTEEPRP